MKSFLSNTSGWFALMTAGLLMPLAAAAQTQIRTDGRLFDASNQIGGSGRYNDARVYSPLNAGNLYATGNARYGQSLRSYSPISDPTAFRGSLGSSSLSNFIRDSVSTADIGSGGWSAGRPQAYYDPARVAPTASYLNGTYSNQYRSSGVVVDPRFAAPGAQSFSGPANASIGPTRIDNRLPGGAGVASPRDSMSSSIFGVSRFTQPGVSALNAPSPSVTDGGRTVPWSTLPPPVSMRDTQPSPYPSAAIDARIRPQPIQPAQPLRTIVDNQMNTSTRDLLAQRSLVWNTPSGTGARAPAGTAPRPADLGVLPESDVFTDMQLALQLKQNPRADWFRDMQRSAGKITSDAPATPTAIREEQEKTAAAAEEFLNRVMTTKVRTFVGKAETPLNDILLKAESLLQIGQYYDAANQYDRAYAMSPTNPLPLIGKSYALLAAGEYASAADSLLRGLDRFPDLARFDLDLAALLGGPEMIDIRRADMMRVLERNEDARLRFLLGYVEYYGGQPERGVQNLEKAAAAAEPGSVIRRYPKLLRGETPGAATSSPVPPADSESPPAPVENEKKE